VAVPDAAPLDHHRNAAIGAVQRFSRPLPDTATV
jgi:hypothetical protein